MSDSLQNKEWMPLEYAALKYSSLFTNGNNKDCFNYLLTAAIQKQLQLSVFLSNPVKAKKGRFISSNEATYKPLSTCYREHGGTDESSPKQNAAFLEAIGLEDKVFECTDVHDVRDNDGDLQVDVARVGTIRGLWDLAMVGNERFYVENLYRKSINSAEIHDCEIDGWYVKSNCNDDFWEIHSEIFIKHGDETQSIICPVIECPVEFLIVVRASSLLDFWLTMNRKISLPNVHFFQLPGLDGEISNFRALLAVPSQTDNILIQGQHGTGKELFVQIFLKSQEEGVSLVTLDCATINPERFSTVTELAAGCPDRLLLLDRLENIDPKNRHALLGSMEKIRVIATTSDESGKIPQEILDRFGIIVNVPPLHERRNDLFHYLGKEYPSLILPSRLLLALYTYNWPGNLRELERTIKKYETTKTFDLSLKKHVDSFLEKFSAIGKLLRDAGMTEDEFERINQECFGNIFQGFLSTTSIYPFGLQDNNLTTSQCKISKHSVAEILVRNGLHDEANSTIDSQAVSTFFKIIFGKESICSATPSHLFEPFTDQSIRFIDLSRNLGPVILQGLDTDSSASAIEAFLKSCECAWQLAKNRTSADVLVIESAQSESGQEADQRFTQNNINQQATIVNVTTNQHSTHTIRQGQPIATDGLQSAPPNFGIEQPETLVTTDSAAAIHPGFETWPNIESELGHARHSILKYAEICKVKIEKNKVGKAYITKEDSDKIKHRFPPKRRRRPRKP